MIVIQYLMVATSIRQLLLLIANCWLLVANQRKV